jgi:hypothetical protein
MKPLQAPKGSRALSHVHVCARHVCASHVCARHVCAAASHAMLDAVAPTLRIQLAVLLPPAIVLFAVLRAATAPSPPRLPSATLDDKRTMFEKIAGDEPAMRATAVKEFPTEAWSADDDFHALEQQKAVLYAHQHRFPVGDVLSALDEGMREGWAPKGGIPLRVSVPPCRPRPIY